eukprot:1160891-Pelagomonas_calceolata.AAC.9
MVLAGAFGALYQPVLNKNSALVRGVYRNSGELVARIPEGSLVVPAIRTEVAPISEGLLVVLAVRTKVGGYNKHLRQGKCTICAFPLFLCSTLLQNAASTSTHIIIDQAPLSSVNIITAQP